MLTSIRNLLLFALLPIIGLAHDVTGKWIFEVTTDAGSGSPTFVFKQAGEKLTGTYTGLFGSAELTGTVKGDDIEFSFEAGTADQKARSVYKGKIESATRMKGTADIGGVGAATWSGAKQ